MHTPRNVQSPYTADDFWDRWNSVNPRMALFIKITPTRFLSGAEVVGLTSNTRDIVLPGHPGLTFRSAAGMIPSEISQSFGEVPTMEFQGIYSDELFRPRQVMSGAFDDASVEIFTAPWDDPNLGELVLFTGNLAEIEHHGTFFKGEIRGLSARLSQETGPVTSRRCRVPFRSTACGFTDTWITIGGATFADKPSPLPANTYPLTISVSASISGGPRSTGFNFDGNNYLLFDGTDLYNSVLPAYGLPPTGFFNDGKITISWIDTQAPIGSPTLVVEREIATYELDETGDRFVITYKRPLPASGILGIDAIVLTTGCTKRIEDCQKYNNVINFRGEPYVPGLETINRVPPPTRF
jgi:hypothetical protein